ncbi:MAG: 3-oxoacyl-[acyl-carrier-protein] synthase III C-terminal domain-containing protein [Bacteroidales bacterium]|nr:3-oxoacyl-[acyl-carrier-protein] synthase III C-terminal domain-containing protein [Bacteroidales bacterium]
MFINALGYYIPSQRVPNSYFLELNGLTSEWIEQRTGILTRSKVSENEDAHTMGIDAVKNAIPNLPYDIKDIDLIVAASYSPIDTVATLAHVAQREFQMEKAKAVYASSACSSLVNGLEIIEGYFAMNKASKALLICSENNTYYSNQSDPKAGHLWGDAAVAFFVSKEKIKESEAEIIDIYTRGLGNIGKGPHAVTLRPKEDGITMPDGRDVFMHACKYMIDALENITRNNNLTINDLSYIICHQANKRIVANVAHQLKLSDEVFLNNISELGNTGSASTGLVLAQNFNKFVKNDLVGLCVFGGGYSSGGFLVKF